MNHNSNKDDFNDDDDSEICFKKKKFAQENVIYLLSRSCALFHNCLSNLSKQTSTSSISFLLTSNFVL